MAASKIIAGGDHDKKGNDLIWGYPLDSLPVCNTAKESEVFVCILSFAVAQTGYESSCPQHRGYQFQSVKMQALKAGNLHEI
jgi:hypothetical protein